MHPIKKIHKVYRYEDNVFETIIVKHYMQKYGIDHVRGCRICDVVLDSHLHDSLTRELFVDIPYSDVDYNAKHRVRQIRNIHKTKKYANRSWFGMIIRAISDVIITFRNHLIALFGLMHSEIK